MKLINEVKLDKPYISVDGSFGGNQGWFADIEKKNKGRTLKGWGCGLIAASDVISFILSGSFSEPESGKKADKRKSMNSPLRKPEKNEAAPHVPAPGNSYTKDEYMNYVLGLEKTFFHILPKLGISGILLSLGMNIYFLINGRKIHKATGHRYMAHWFVRPGRLLTSIQEMLGNGIPVIIAIGPGFLRKDKVVFYDRREEGGGLHFKPVTKTKDHYVTVTGLIEAEGRTLLEISSWGKRYYMDYDEYMNYVRKNDNFYFSNILYIKRW